MTLANLVDIQYCYDYLINQIPVGLLLYSHIPTGIIALLFGTYIFVTSRTREAFALFVVSAAFALWCFADLSSWFAFLGSGVTMFTWSLLDMFGLIFFFFSFYFLYTFIYKEDLPVWQKVFGIALILPTVLSTLLGMNLLAFDANTCEALEHPLIKNYPYVAQFIFIISSFVMGIHAYIHAPGKKERIERLFATIGVLVFLVFFFTATFTTSILVNYEKWAEYAYNFEIYGLFGIPVLIICLGYLIVRYRAFDVKVFAAQALVAVLIVVMAAEYAFVESLVNRILVAITLILTGFAGVLLVRSVKREIEQRERIQLLATDLEKANKQQIILIGFITHQIKGFVAKSRNIFAGLREGDYGVMPEAAKPLIEEGFNSDTRGVETIKQILDASNVKSGKVEYKNEIFDLKATLEEIIKDLKLAADAKGLALTSTFEQISFTGDRGQLVNAFKNLIDNSIKYTPSGSVDVSLKSMENKIHFEIHDTGVGIDAEDMSHLFTEGGHGKNSQKVNVESTGFGLYIVKNIIEAHKGKVWAESEGEGKGSRFIVELPVSVS